MITISKDIHEKDYLEKQGGKFHIRLMQSYNDSKTEEEKENQKDEDMLCFDFVVKRGWWFNKENFRGEYSIKYGDLKKRYNDEKIKNNI